jgi:hypothetical protein
LKVEFFFFFFFSLFPFVIVVSHFMFWVWCVMRCDHMKFDLKWTGAGISPWSFWPAPGWGLHIEWIWSSYISSMLDWKGSTKTSVAWIVVHLGKYSLFFSWMPWFCSLMGKYF